MVYNHNICYVSLSTDANNVIVTSTNLCQVSVEHFKILQVISLDQQTRFAKQAMINERVRRVQLVQQHVCIYFLRCSEYNNFKELGNSLQEIVQVRSLANKYLVGNAVESK
jgi:hypothetical protein